MPTPWPRCCSVNTLSPLLFPRSAQTKMKWDKKELHSLWVSWLLSFYTKAFVLILHSYFYMRNNILNYCYHVHFRIPPHHPQVIWQPDSVSCSFPHISAAESFAKSFTSEKADDLATPSYRYFFSPKEVCLSLSKLFFPTVLFCQLASSTSSIVLQRLL